MKLKPSEPVELSQRLTVRMTYDDWQMLRELQACLHLPSPGRTIRTLIRMHHGAERAALKRLKRDPHYRERIEGLVGKPVTFVGEKPKRRARA